MKRYILIVLIITAAASCVKKNVLPAYTPPLATNFSVTSLAHTKDTVNIGDTVYVNVAGNASDSSKSIYAYLSVSSAVNGSSSVYSVGTASAPIKLKPTFGSPASALYPWTATIMLPGATMVPHKTKLTITGNFIYQLSLSSQQGKLSATDAGILNKTVYVQ
jgi:hypothetical protein